MIDIQVATQRILSCRRGVLFCLPLLLSTSTLWAVETSRAKGSANSLSSNSAIFEDVKTSKVKPYDLKIVMKLGMAQSSSLSDERTAGSLRAESSFGYHIIDELTLKLDVHLLLLSQRAQQDVVSDAFDEGFRLKQGLLEYRPWKPLALSAGVINQQRNFHFIPFLVDDRGFPGAAQSFTFVTGDFSTMFYAQEGVPTSRSLNSNRVEKEATPTYFSQGVKVDWRPSNTFRLATFGLHYSYQNLPSVVAADGYGLGNTLTPDSSPTSSRFAYGFDGIAFGLGEEWNFLPHYSVGLEIQTLRNLRAPQAYNSAIFLVGDVCFCFSTIEVRPAFISFFNESDTAPAVYNDGRFSHNNREGSGGQLKLTLPKSKFSILGRYINADVINESANGQTRSDFFEIFLETSYENLL